MLDCDNIRKDEVLSLDSVTPQTAVPHERVRRSLRVYNGRVLCTKETALCMSRWCGCDLISENKLLVGFS
jgi:hypothetical protein